MEESKKLMPIDAICNRVYTIRGQQVMLDYDLAEIYGYEVKALNQQVRRNISRFPEDFMFQLDWKEIPENCLKSQIVTLNEQGNKRGMHMKKLPYAFYVVDDYMNAKTLQLLSQKKQGVEVILFTENGHGRKGFLTEAVVKDFIMQFPPLRIKPNQDCHDRFIIIDYGMSTEQAYHCGASSKDAGKKLCAINKLENTSMIHPVIDELLARKDKKV